VNELCVRPGKLLLYPVDHASLIIRKRADVPGSTSFSYGLDEVVVDPDVRHRFGQRALARPNPYGS
jgi:hypothetical protein